MDPQEKNDGYIAYGHIAAALTNEKRSLENLIAQTRAQIQSVDQQIRAVEAFQESLQNETAPVYVPMQTSGRNLHHAWVLTNQLHNKIANLETTLKGVKVAIKEIGQCGLSLTEIPSK